MRIRARRSLVALVLTGGVLLAGSTAAVAAPSAHGHAHAHAQAVSVAKRPVPRFVAWQACRAAVWEWVAENAADGSSVDTHLNHYRPTLEWRHHGGWFVQIAGTAHEPVTANNRSSYCLVKGTNASPKIVAHAYPR